MGRGQKLRHAYAGSTNRDQTYQTKNMTMNVYIKKGTNVPVQVLQKKWKGLTRETVPWSENEDK